MKDENIKQLIYDIQREKDSQKQVELVKTFETTSKTQMLSKYSKIVPTEPVLQINEATQPPKTLADYCLRKPTQTKRKKQSLDATPDKLDFDDQSLKEQMFHILHYLDSEPNQMIIPDGRVRLLKETLGDYKPYNEVCYLPLILDKTPKMGPNTILD